MALSEFSEYRVPSRFAGLRNGIYFSLPSLIRAALQSTLYRVSLLMSGYPFRVTS